MKEEIKVPSYEEYLEKVWFTDFEWVLEDKAQEYNDKGIYLNKEKHRYSIYYDLYYRMCNGDGDIDNCERFIQTYYDRLASISPVLTEIFREGGWLVKWTATHRQGGLSFDIGDEYWASDEEFTQGMFMGLNKEELFEAETDEAKQNFEEEIKTIIREVYEDILDALIEQDKHMSSEEAYQEWLKDWKEYPYAK
jgi:hypothetical protein